METILAGHYQILRHLGGGGFGQTFLAKDVHLPGHPVCVVKQLKPSVSDPDHLQTAQRLFNQEAETLYRLGSHDQIPRLLAHFEQNQEFYLVQEYIEGQLLNREIIPGKPLSETYAISLLQDVLQALAFVHQQHVIHRDIKPTNLIRRNSDCRIVLIDFGAVKEVRSHTATVSGPTTMTVAIGSPGYMPSEQQAFKPHYSSDLYAVGMVCIEALTGLRPKDFPRDPETEEFSCALMRSIVSISPELATFLDKMVRYDYRQRYPNATEALKALYQILGQSVSSNSAASQDFPTVAHSYSQENRRQLTDRQPGHAQEITSPPGSTQLSSDLKKSLEQLLAGSIGPIASVVLKRTLEQAQTPEDLVERLVFQLPESQQPHFREQANRLLKRLGEFSLVKSKVQTQEATVAPTTLSPAVPAIDPNFVKRCEQELAKSIGPIAPLIVQRTLSQQPALSRIELIETLAKHLPNSGETEAFRKTLLVFP
ncbi:MAG: serine/threonine protein kinase [Leptolyngbyaceae cyanobacterium RU_5_1]|nr:serine/threonine protein kinase [Leptolyngbyaceae cyanobacterium RU_5_1]